MLISRLSIIVRYWFIIYCLPLFFISSIAYIVVKEMMKPGDKKYHNYNRVFFFEERL